MRVLKKIFSYVLDCVMPPYEGVRELESMDAAAFIEAVRADGASEKARPLPVEGLVSPFPYRARLAKAAIVEIKTHMNRPVARLLAEATYKEVRPALEGFAAGSGERLPLLAPVPMSRQGLRERGWNQCELVCAELDRIDGKGKKDGRLFEYAPNALYRTRDTPDQVGMDKAKRAENLKGSFAGQTDILTGRDVVILDDVTTTGATLREARAAATAVGARRVLLLSIGH